MLVEIAYYKAREREALAGDTAKASNSNIVSSSKLIVTLKNDIVNGINRHEMYQGMMFQKRLSVQR